MIDKVKKNLNSLGFAPEWSNSEWKSRSNEIQSLLSKSGHNKQMPGFYNRSESSVLCGKTWSYQNSCPSSSNFWPTPQTCWKDGGNKVCRPEKPKQVPGTINKKINFSKGDALLVNIKNYFQSNNRWDKSKFVYKNLTPNPTPTPSPSAPTPTSTLYPTPTSTLYPTPTPTSVEKIVAFLSSSVYLNLDIKSIDSKLVSQESSYVNINLDLISVAKNEPSDGSVVCGDDVRNLFSTTTTPSP